MGTEYQAAALRVIAEALTGFVRADLLTFATESYAIVEALEAKLTREPLTAAEGVELERGWAVTEILDRDGTLKQWVMARAPWRDRLREYLERTTA
jgi:hypothetical protein